MLKPLKMFIPITKVDAAKRLVYGVATGETPDLADEICDYETTKPFYQKWSGDIEKATGGKSLGNVRSMHSNVAAGKVTAIDFDDVNKTISICAKVVDDAEWKKVEEGVYSGFSQGGAYIKRWPDPTDATKMRYTAEPIEVSLVDVPCLPTATFSYIKADGATEMRKFNSPVEKPTILNVDLGAEHETEEEIAAAKAAAAKAEPVAPEQVWKATDGSTHAKKADCIKKNAELAAEAVAKAATAPAAEALAKLEAAVAAKEEPVKPVISPEDLTKLLAAIPASVGKASPAEVASWSRLLAASEDKKEPTSEDVAAVQGMVKRLTPPPEAPKPRTKEEVEAAVGKGLGTVARLANLIQELDWLQEGVEWEAVSEQDNSSLPAELKQDVASLCSTLRAMVIEETEELLDNTEMKEFGELMMAAASAVDLSKVLPINPASTPILDLLKKSQEKREALVKAAPAPEDQVAKLEGEKNALQKIVDGFKETVDKLTKRVEQVEKTPLPTKGVVRVVDGAQVVAINKGDATKIKDAQDTPVSTPEAILDILKSLSPQERADVLMKAALASGRPVHG